MSERITVAPGDTLHGFCAGYFGRDSHLDKTILALGSYDGNIWVVAAETGGGIVTGVGMTAEDLTEWAGADPFEEE